MASLRVGIVGLPDQISVLVPILQSLNIKVTAIWCKGDDTRRKLSDKYHLPFLSGGFHELLVCSEVDLVYVATEPRLQAELAVKALTSGKHCICQRPPSTSRKEAEKMVSLSRYYPLICLLESHLRFLPALKKMKELVATGDVGKPLIVEARVVMGSLIQSEPFSWKCDPSMGGGVLNIVGSQIIDLVSYVTGEKAEKVYGHMKTFTPHTDSIHGYRTITSDDFCVFQMQCTNNLSVTVTLHTHLQQEYQFDFSVTGTKASLAVRGLNLYRNSDTILKQDKTNFRFSCLDLSTKFPAEFYLPHVLGCQELFSSLSLDSTSSKVTTASATFEDGLYIRTVLDSIHLSAGRGQWVGVPAEERRNEDTSKSNPFWTNHSTRQDTDKPSPKLIRSVHS